MKLQLTDLKPQEATFTLEKTGERVHTLKIFSLRDRIWLKERFKTTDEIKAIFESANLGSMAELAFHMLKDKSPFKDFLDFADHVVSIPDQMALMKAVIKTVGIDDEAIKKLTAQVSDDPNAESPLPTT